VRIENEARKDSKNIKNENVERFGGVSGIARCPQCKECDSHKPADQFADVFTRSKADRCLGCQYPSCTHCPGYRHPRAKKAVQISHKIGGKWFCRRSKACEQAAMSARKA
jgi:hypothetical protein